MLCLLLVLAAASPENSWAQVQSVAVVKGYNYIQTGPSTIAIDPAITRFRF